MRDIIYNRLSTLESEGLGYIQTSELLKKGFTNRQIALLTDEKFLERVTYGIYWIPSDRYDKPDHYKAIEVIMSDPEAVICADSACYYHGIIEEEPLTLAVATKRSDRRKLDMQFPTTRYYISDSIYDQGIDTVETDYGQIRIYNAARSVCDCFKYKNKIDQNSFEQIKARFDDETDVAMINMKKRILAYAKAFRVCMSGKTDL